MSRNRSVLLLTDFSYQAKGREYFREDVELSCYLRKYFQVCVSHIHDMEKFMDLADAILIRNTGPQISHRDHLNRLRNRNDLVLSNDLAGKGDIRGKDHLLELFHSGYPVIPTFTSKEELEKYGTSEQCLCKPLDGADSSGVNILHLDAVNPASLENCILQPLVEFLHEISFYFIGNQFYYSLFAPDPQKRWELKPYQASKEDVSFALQFIEWNSCKSGIQRVDACRLVDGRLLLMELEDYNPFLSLELLQPDVKVQFLEGLCASLNEQMQIDH